MTRVAITGDTRDPIWLDLFRGPTAGDRQAVLDAIGAERPGFLLLLGDLVDGAFASSWAAFDRSVAGLRAAGVAMDAVPGNHEYYGIVPRIARPGHRLAPFVDRFARPEGVRWRTRDVDSARLLLLDSNAGAHASAELAAQEAWLERAVAEADADARVAIVFAAWHHPPFTNVEGYDDDVFSARSFLPRLRRSRKLGAIFCGHVHGYERHRVDGVSLVVSGGGGAHPHRFPTDHARWRHTPAFDASALPHLHYVVVDLDGERATATVRHLERGRGAEPRLIPGDRFEIRRRA
ncbi:MAG TPA: metallophosphoesterase [Planctomycetota bacterium]|nr:metallophosphoesterase [Planctomycetota bacterium]